MAEVTLEFIGEQLRRLLDETRLIRDDLADMTARQQAIETALVDLRRDVVNLHGDVVRIDHRLDRLDQRVARIERRLDLVEA